MKLRSVVDRTLLLYIVIGVSNFLLCNGIMFLLYNLCDFSEHSAPLVNYALGSVIWFFSCRFILFRDSRTDVWQLLRFVIEVLVCYLLSYYVVAALLTPMLLRSSAVVSFFGFGGEEKLQGNCLMTVGTASYAILNYFGQRYFVFHKRYQTQNARQ